jgi:NAD(P)-dependent dehydrogenase (short-subunit alcohol dehydrogenase family)
MARFQWLTHEGKQVLLLDFTQNPAKRIEQLAREVQQIITAQPPGSVLVLADFTDATFSTDALKQIARAAAANRRHVARTAWVGVNLPEAQFKALQNLSGRDIRRFATREEALEFLTNE